MTSRLGWSSGCTTRAWRSWSCATRPPRWTSAGSPNVTLADPEHPAEGCELVCVLGGDGTILRGAEMSRGTGAPLLGVNLGHVGFLAESEREDLDATVERIVARDYAVEERMTLEVTVQPRRGPGLLQLGAQRGDGGEGLARAHARARPSRSTGGRCRPGAVTAWSWRPPPGRPPTRSPPAGRSSGPTSRRCSSCRSAPTRCSPAPWSSARAPTWPSRSSPDTQGAGVLWCDGRRAIDLPPGARIEVVRSDTPVRLARLTSSPFTDRLVAKFDLSDPRLARRGPARAAGQDDRLAVSLGPRRRPLALRACLSRCQATSEPCDSLGACCRRSGSRTSASSTTPSWSCTPA